MIKPGLHALLLSNYLRGANFHAVKNLYESVTGLLFELLEGYQSKGTDQVSTLANVYFLELYSTQPPSTRATMEITRSRADSE